MSVRISFVLVSVRWKKQLTLFKVVSEQKFGSSITAATADVGGGALLVLFVLNVCLKYWRGYKQISKKKTWISANHIGFCIAVLGFHAQFAVLINGHRKVQREPGILTSTVRLRIWYYGLSCWRAISWYFSKHKKRKQLSSAKKVPCIRSTHLCIWMHKISITTRTVDAIATGFCGIQFGYLFLLYKIFLNTLQYF